MRGTNHPSIVKLYSFSESQEHYFLVLEGRDRVMSDPSEFFNIFVSHGRRGAFPPDCQTHLL